MMGLRITGRESRYVPVAAPLCLRREDDSIVPLKRTSLTGWIEQARKKVLSLLFQVY